MPDEPITVNVETSETVVVRVEDASVTAVLIPADQGPAGPQGPPGPAGATTYSKTAAAAISGHRVVAVLEDDTVQYADHAALEDAHRVLGVTTGAAAQGGTATIAGTGAEIVEPSWSWTPGAPLYLGAAGALTHTPPSTGFLLRIGAALSATRILVRIEEPIIL